MKKIKRPQPAMLSLAKILEQSDEEFLKTLIDLHDTFVKYVWSLMKRGAVPKYQFKSIAENLAVSKGYMLLCDRIYIPIPCGERLLKILNTNQEKFNDFRKAE